MSEEKYRFQVSGFRY